MVVLEAEHPPMLAWQPHQTPTEPRHLWARHPIRTAGRRPTRMLARALAVLAHQRMQAWPQRPTHGRARQLALQLVLQQ